MGSSNRIHSEFVHTLPLGCYFQERDSAVDPTAAMRPAQVQDQLLDGSLCGAALFVRQVGEGSQQDQFRVAAGQQGQKVHRGQHDRLPFTCPDQGNIYDQFRLN